MAFEDDVLRAFERAREEAEAAIEQIEDVTAPVRDPIKETLEDFYHDIGVPAPWEVPGIVEEKVDELREWIFEDEEVHELDEIFDDLDLPPPPPEEEEEESEEEDDDWDLLDWLAFGWLLDELLEFLDGDHDILSFDVDITLWTDEPEPEDDGEETVITLRRHFFFAPVPFAARLLDPMGHGGFAVPGPGSPDVLIGGLPALRMIDQIACPMQLPIPHTPTTFVPSITDVFINGVPALRAGDFMPEGLGGPNPIVMGCPTVIVGKPVPPVECFEFTSSTVKKEHEPEKFRWTKTEYGNIKGQVHVGFNLYGPYVRFEGEVEAAHLYAETTPEFSEHVKIEAEVILGKVEVKDARIFTSWKNVAMRKPKPEFSYELGDKKAIEIPEPEVDFDLPWE